MGDLERALGRNTLLIPALSVALGIYLSLTFTLGWIWGMSILFIACFVYLSILKFSKDPVSAYKFRNYHFIWLAMLFCGLGILTSSFRSHHYIDITCSDSDFLIVGIIESVEEKNHGDVMIVNVNNIKGNGFISDDRMKLKVNLNGQGGKIETGDIVSIYAPIERIEDNPNSFYKGYKTLMNSKGIYYACNVEDRNLKIIGHRNTLGYYCDAIRLRIERFIENTSLNKSAQNFIITLLLGDRLYLDPQLKASFSEAGVSHVLALSGMHVGIIGGVFLFLLFPINFYGKYKLRLILTALLLWIYALVSGMSPSTVRACIMITFVTIAIIAERKRYALNALCGSILFILLYSPQTLLDVGFQLSVICVGALILFTDALNQFARGDNRIIYNFAEMVFATMVATSASWIITCYYFHSFPLAFLPANMIMLPILPFYLCVSIIYLIFSLIGISPGFLRIILDNGYDVIDKIIDFIGGNSSVEIWVGYESVLFWLFGLTMIAIYLNLYKWRPMLISGVVSLALAVICLIFNNDTIAPGSMIITDHYHSFDVNVKTSDSEELVAVKRYSNREVTIGESKIIIFDSPLSDDNFLNPCDYLIIGGSFKGDVRKAAEAVAPAAIIIHPSVRRKRESEYIETLKESGFSVHSLRLDKPFRIPADSRKPTERAKDVNRGRKTVDRLSPLLYRTHGG